jgi:glucosylceramidase
LSFRRRFSLLLGGVESFGYDLPAKTSATFTWSGTQQDPAVTGLDVTNQSTADGALLRLWGCTGGTNQK